MRQPRRELAHRRDAPCVGDLLPQQLCLLLGLFARGHVASGATDQDRLAGGVELDAALEEIHRVAPSGSINRYSVW